MPNETPVVDKNKKESKKLKDAREYFSYVKEHPFEKKYREDCYSKLNYFTGSDQGWDDKADRATLEAEGRPALTLNHIQPLFRLVIGARPKIETTYLPTKGDTAEGAKILEACKDHVEDINRFSYMEDTLFKLGAITDRAGIAIWPDKKKDVRGEIKIEQLDGFQAYPDPDAVLPDRSDGMRFIYIKDVAPEEAKRLFPKHKKEIDDFLKNYKENSSPNQSRDTDPVDRYKDKPTDYYNGDSKKMSLIYYWWKTFEKATKIVDKTTARVIDSTLKIDEAEDRIAAAGIGDRFIAIEMDYTRVHYLIYCYDVLLEEGITPWERKDGKRTWLSDNFPYLLWEPERVVIGAKQELISMMTSYMDPQKYHNKLASSILHIINSQAKSGYDYEEGALSPTEKTKLETMGSKPGTNIEWNKGALSQNMVRLRVPSNAAQSEMAVALQMSQAIVSVGGTQGVSQDPMGKNTPAKVKEMKVMEGSNVVSYIYRSFSFFLNTYAEAIRDAIQLMYDYEKVIRIRGAKAKTVKINEQMYDYRGAVIKTLNDVDEDSFDTQIREKEELPTLRLERLKHFSEMIKSGQLALPPQVLTKVILELMDDPDLKDTVEEEMGRFMEEQKQIMQQAAVAKGGGGMPQGRPAPAPMAQTQ